MSSPTITAPADVVVGEASGSVSLRVSLSAPGTSTVSVAYTTANGTALNSTACFSNVDSYVGVKGTLTFAAGVTSKVVKVKLNNCHVAGFGSFTFNLSTTPTNATTARDSTSIGIVGDGNVTSSPGLYARNAVVDTGAGTVAIPVLLGGPSGTASTSTVTVHYATSNGTAIAGTDYTMKSGTLTFGPGQTAEGVAVAITKRTSAAPSRSFTLTLSSPVNAVIVNGTGTVVIGASGAAAVSAPSIAAPPDVVVGETDGYVDLAVSLSAPGTSTVSVTYTTGNGTALSSTSCFSNVDSYIGVPPSGVPGTLTFAPGETTKAVRVDLNDCHVAGLGSFTFNLSTTPTNATTARDSTNIGIVGDGNLTASPGLYARNAVVDTGAGTVAIPVLLGGSAGTASTSTVAVHYATSNGTAIAGTDYTMTSGTLTFGPGQTAENVAVAITKRTTPAPLRSFTLTLSSPVNASIVNGTGTVVIGASGAASVSTPSISAPPDVVVGEIDGYVDLPVSLSAPGTSTVSVTYNTGNGTALSSTSCFSNADSYVEVPPFGVPGTLTFAPGETTKVVRVDINNCHVVGLGSFTFNLSTTPVNATTARDSTNIGIVGDGNVTASPGLYARNAVVDTGAGTVAIPVLLGGPAGSASNSTVTMNYATSNGTATAGTDYTMTSGTLTFGPGQTAENVAVAITKRTTSVPSRSFTLTLSSPVNATIVNGTGTVVIGASGAASVSTPSIAAAPDIAVAEVDGYVDLPVSLSAPGTNTVSVTYATANGTALNSTACFSNTDSYVGVPPSGVPGTLTFAPGETTKVVRVDINSCNVSGSFTFTLKLSTPVNATIGRASMTITITH